MNNGADFNLVKGEIESYEMEEMTRGDTEETRRQQQEGGVDQNQNRDHRVRDRDGEGDGGGVVSRFVARGSKK